MKEHRGQHRAAGPDDTFDRRRGLDRQFRRGVPKGSGDGGDPAIAQWSKRLNTLQAEPGAGEVQTTRGSTMRSTRRCSREKQEKDRRRRSKAER